MKAPPLLSNPPLTRAAARWIAVFHWAGKRSLRLLQAAGWVLGWVTWLLSASYRRHWRENTLQSGIDRRAALSSVGAAGQMVAELPKLWFGSGVPTEWRGSELIDAALDSGKSILFLTPHLSAFDLTVVAYAQRWGQIQPITVLFQPPNKPQLGPLLAQGRNRPGVRAVPTDLSGVKGLLKALRQGGVVGLLPDQVPPQGMGVAVPFFGRPAYTMTLASRLADLADEVMLASVERLSGARGFVIHVSRPDGELPQGDATAATAVVNRWMEALIRRNPGQYLWGYHRYK